MSVGAINSLSSVSASTGSSTSSTSSQTSALNLSFTSYLKILTTQLQNQDPTNATDPNQFTQELIMMQQVQTQITTNSNLEALTATMNSNALASGVGYIDNYVRAETEDGDFSLQGSSAEVGYTLSSAASGVTITIKDADGDVVAKLKGGADNGDNYVTWDGTQTDGTKAADGTYTFAVSATSNSGSTVTVSNLSALYKVTAVQSNGDGTLTLEADDLSMLSTDVTGVYTASTLPSATAGVLITS